MNPPSIEDLILAGAVEVAGIDSTTGEFLYQFTDKLKDVLPDLYKAHIANVHNEVMFFFEHGFVDILDMTEQNPVVKLTPKAFDENELSKLLPEHLYALNEIKRILKVV